MLWDLMWCICVLAECWLIERSDLFPVSYLQNQTAASTCWRQRELFKNINSKPHRVFMKPGPNEGEIEQGGVEGLEERMLERRRKSTD